MAEQLQPGQILSLKAGAAARYQQLGVPPKLAEVLFDRQLDKVSALLSQAMCGKVHGKVAKKPKVKKQYAK